MERNNYEKSLKRWLKRRVKITLGLMVAFMITGAVGYAEELVNNDTFKITLNENTIDVVYITWDNKEIPITLNKDLDIFSDSENKIYSKNINNALNIFKNINENPKNELDLSETTYDEGLKLSESEQVKSEIGNDITKLANEVNGSIYVNNSSDSERQLFLSTDTDVRDTYENITLINKGTIKNDETGTNSHGQYVRGKENLNVYNYGKIQVKPENPTFGESSGQCVIGKNSTAYNYGIIEASYGQYGRMSSVNNYINTKIYNYGILTGRTGQFLHKTYFTDSNEDFAFAVNNGIIIGNINGQVLMAENSKMENNGLIITHEVGQMIQPSTDEGTKNSEVYNYGLIETFGGGGQVVSALRNKKIVRINNSTAYNMGILSNNVERGINTEDSHSMGGQNVYDDGNIINYGIIKTTGQGGQILYTSQEHKSEEKMSSINNGLINSKDYGIRISYNSNVANTKNFDAEAINNGIVIVAGDNAFSDNTENNNKFNDKKITKNNGIALKRTGNGLELHSQVYKSGESVNSDTYNLIENKSITDIENDTTIVENQKNNIFVNNLDKDSNVTLTIDKDTLSSQHITAVTGKESANKTAVEAGNLTLNDSTIIGYFEKDGTLLEVNGDLTLNGESVINAIAGNSYTGYTGDILNNVVAVNLTNKGILTLSENSKVLGMVKGEGTVVFENNKESHNDGINTKLVYIETSKENGTDIKLSNVTTPNLIIRGEETSKDNTKILLGNNINIREIRFNEQGTNKGLGADITLGDGQTNSDDTIKIDSITLGTGNDVITINNKLSGLVEIDGNGGDDTVILKNLTGNHNTFDYQLDNINTLDLNNQTWKIGDKAEISHSNAKDKTTVQNGTLRADMKFEVGGAGNTAVFKNENVSDILTGSDFGDKGYLQLGIGAGSELEAGKSYTTEFEGVNEDYVKVAGIFNKTNEETLTVKTAKEMKIEDKYSIIYNRMLAETKNNSEILDVLNNIDSSDIANSINQKGKIGETLGTIGYKITRDISNSFMSAVNEWGKKAGKGEWLANAKYINSDVEYDGANDVKGYDSDIKSMIGMIEYGVSEKTAYGIALGGGDTEIDVDGAGKLEGDNYYVGAYVKHEVNGFDLVGNLGYTISDLEVDGNGSADSSAITFGGYVKKDVRLTDTIKLEPNVSFTYDYIMQDDAEGNGVKVEGKDIHVFEASAGMNIVKEFAFETGKLELRAGAKYSMADINRNEETVISVYGIDDINLGNPEVDKTRGTAHIGFDYEHETGFGVNGKYEMMWSDSGDDSRITAGISYRF